jgi:Mn2+/Fe2+ NRAMP family transporter
MTQRVPLAPRGLAIFAVVGPSLIWCAEYIGSGEVVLATRTGALLGIGTLWAIAVGILLKYVIGLAGAQWTAITGEGMIDLFARIPGPRHWLVWLVLAVQFPAAIVSIGALAKLAGVFLNTLLPLPSGQILWGLAASLFAVAVAWSGRFDLLKIVMSGLVAVIVAGTLYAAVVSMPPLIDVAKGFAGLIPLEIPAWAPEAADGHSPWLEILPLMGWAAGGFASQVWYTYWVLGAGYGMAAGRGYGKPADEARLAALDREEAGRLRGWCRVVRFDATLALVIGIVITTAFALAGAGVLRPAQLVPAGSEVAFTLSRLFSEHWGQFGAILFLLAGSASMVSTLVGQLAGWPRLLADCARILFPPVARLPWKLQFRGILVFFVLTNLVAVFLFDPVKLVQFAGQLDGILLTPIQAAAVLAAFVFVLPRLVPRETLPDLRLGRPVFIGLIISTLVFGVLCVTVLPANLKALLLS